MEEADNIVITGLRELGVPVGRGIYTIKEMIESDASLVYEAAATYMRLIDPSIGDTIHEQLPSQMRQRVSSCTKLAKAIKERGYKGDINYHQILYPSDGDARTLFVWCAEALPKQREDFLKKEKTSGDLLSDSIGSELQRLSKQLRSLLALQGKMSSQSFTTAHLVTPNKGRVLRTTPGLARYFDHYLPVVSQQISKPSDLGPSVFETNLKSIVNAREAEMEWNRRGMESGLNPIQYRKKRQALLMGTMAGHLQKALSQAQAQDNRRLNENLNQMMNDYARAAKSSSDHAQGLFSRTTHFATEDKSQEGTVSIAKESIEERILKQTDELRSIEKEIMRLQDQINVINEETQSFVNLTKQSDSQRLIEEGKRVDFEQQYLVKKRTFDLIPQADKNIKELQYIAGQAAQKILTLATEWESHRLPLLIQLRKLRSVEEGRVKDVKKMMEEIQAMQKEMKDHVTDIQQKDEHYKQLIQMYKQMPHDQNRNIYTRRIIEIVKNVKKQKVDIAKILHDTKNLQKELNTVEDSLSRVSALTDEMLFAEAKKESKLTFAKDSYHHFASITDAFKKLVVIYEEMGTARNTILKIEAKIEQVQSRSSTLNLDRVKSDLKEIKNENTLLRSK